MLLLALVFLLPLLVFVKQVLFGDRFLLKGDILSTVSIALCFGASLYLFASIWNQTSLEFSWQWMCVGSQMLYLNFRIDNLAVLMLVLVSSISLLVHIYSFAYMKGDAFYHRYWAYLSLFGFAMMGLVVANSLLLMYIFWELVGLASYLLIGFWFQKQAAVYANKKAFLINRIGDLGFLTGIGIVYAYTHQLNITELFANPNNLKMIPDVWLCLAGIGFFMATMAKSAQFPLHIWLPDAMEGPTSVSALIHAATMVAAGVFLMARVYPIFTPEILIFVAIIGTFTALMAAIKALGQRDLKRILAFSTISQLGYMVCAMGLGVPQQALFHLVTHAFFKCLLFLSAGVIIHQLQHYFDHHYPNQNINSQDIKNMGGLSKQLPLVAIVMGLACMALAGLPFSSGALSKENIILVAWHSAQIKGGLGWILFWGLFVTSIVTAIYTTRMIYYIFISPSKYNFEHFEFTLKFQFRIPLVILAIMSSWLIFSFNPIDAHKSWLLQGLQAPPLEHNYALFLILNVCLFVTVLLTYTFYKQLQEIEISFSKNHQRGLVYSLFSSLTAKWARMIPHTKYHKSDIYVAHWALLLAKFSQRFDQSAIEKTVAFFPYITQKLAILSDNFDRSVVDYGVNQLGKISQNIGYLFRKTQSGFVQQYMLWVLSILILGMFWLLAY